MSAAVILAGGVALSAGQIQLPAEPPRGFGSSITASFEGWFQNPDGSRSFLIGYLNRNRAKAMDVPIGPNNRIEPGGPDQGQPTHFLPGRQTGVFVIPVPQDFTPQQQLTWTITVNGQTTMIPFKLNPDYNISPLKIRHDLSFLNTPPIVRFDQNAPAILGPIATPLKPALTLTASADKPLALTVWTEDDAKYSSGTNAPMKNPPPPVTLTWSKYRGPGTVTFDADKPKLQTLAGGGVGELFRGNGVTTATFSEPGEYLLHVTANDYSGEGGGGEMCCWTTAIVKVSVTR
ncbi:MAG: hypothetical protein HY654_11850 [Acidobacteria bacterium]|nr:hypothetical protein [Acidobacteriota bacterium]